MSEARPSTISPPPGYIPASVFQPEALDDNERAYKGLIARRGLAAIYGDPNAGKTSWLMAQLYKWNRGTGAYGPMVLYIALEGVEDAREWAAAHRRAMKPEYPYGHRPGKFEYRVDPNLAVVAPENFDLLDRKRLDAWLDSMDAGGGRVTDGEVEGWTTSPGPLTKDEMVYAQSMQEYAAATSAGRAGKGPQPVKPKPPQVPNDVKAERILEWATVTQPDIIVVDSLSRAIAGADENDNGTMSAAAQALEYLRDQFGAKLLIVIHHPAAGSSEMRGGRALLGAVDSATHVSHRGDILTVKNRKARGFQRGHVKRYQRRPDPWISLDESEPDLFRMEFDELAAEPSRDEGPGASAQPLAAPSDLAPAPCVAAEASTPVGTKAVETGPVGLESVSVQPTPPVHPAEALRGRPALFWKALGLKPGDTIQKGEAVARLKPHPALEGVPANRRSVRIHEAFATFARLGLVDSDAIRNPA